MDWKQKENRERWARTRAAREWVASEHGPDEGFAEWYGNTGRKDPYADAHAVWLTSSARIERWAERSGIYIGRAFARWYIETGRTDPYPAAYDAHCVLNGRKTNAEMDAELEALRAEAEIRETLSLPELARRLGWKPSSEDSS